MLAKYTYNGPHKPKKQTKQISKFYKNGLEYSRWKACKRRGLLENRWSYSYQNETQWFCGRWRESNYLGIWGENILDPKRYVGGRNINYPSEPSLESYQRKKMLWCSSPPLLQASLNWRRVCHPSSEGSDYDLIINFLNFTKKSFKNHLGIAKLLLLLGQTPGFCLTIILVTDKWPWGRQLPFTCCSSACEK